MIAGNTGNVVCNTSFTNLSDSRVKTEMAEADVAELLQLYGRLPSADERGEELQPSVRRRAAAGGRGLHDRPQHGGAGDPAGRAAATRRAG